MGSSSWSPRWRLHKTSEKRVSASSQKVPIPLRKVLLAASAQNSCCGRRIHDRAAVRGLALACGVLYSAFAALLVRAGSPEGSTKTGGGFPSRLITTYLGLLILKTCHCFMQGNCSIPLTLVVLGGFMHEEKPPQNKDDKTRNGRKRSDGSKAPDKRAESMSKRRPLFNKRTSLRKSTAPARKGETRTVIVAILSRMFITPALLLPLLWWFSLNESSVADGSSCSGLLS